MQVIEVSARKGGVGTTTVACAIALRLSALHPDRVLLCDASEGSESFSVLGLSAPLKDNPCSTIHGLTVVASETIPTGSEYEFVVIDAGKTNRVVESYFGVSPFRVSVVTNSYLSLRAETQRFTTPHAVVAIHNEDHVLNKKDVANVLRATPTYVAVDNSVARAIDAGLYPMRDILWSDWTSEFLQANDISTVSA